MLKISQFQISYPIRGNLLFKLNTSLSLDKQNRQLRFLAFRLSFQILFFKKFLGFILSNGITDENSINFHKRRGFCKLFLSSNF